MVGTDIQQDRDMRLETLDTFELEARKLDDHQTVRRRRPRLDDVDHRVAQVPANEERSSETTAHLADERRDRTLAVRSSDGHNRRVDEARRELDLPDDWNSTGLGRVDHVERGYARRHDDQVDSSEGGLRMATQHELHPELLDLVVSGPK